MFELFSLHHQEKRGFPLCQHGWNGGPARVDQVACVTVAQELQVEESQVRDLAASCIDAGLIDASLDRNNGVITFVHASHRLTTYAQWKLLREHHQRLEELMRVALDRHVAREPWVNDHHPIGKGPETKLSSTHWPGRR